MVGCLVVFVFVTAWCMCCGDYRLSFGGGSYSSVYVPLPISVFPMILIMHIPSHFFPSCYILCSYFLVHIAPGFTFSQLCEHYPRLDENFWGVYAYVFHHMQLYVYFEICVLNISYLI